MVARGEIYWANLGQPSGRRPVVVLTRDSALSYLHWVTVAPITTTIHEIPSEVQVGPEDGLARESAVACDNVVTVGRRLLEGPPICQLGPLKTRELDEALMYALGIAI